MERKEEQKKGISIEKLKGEIQGIGLSAVKKYLLLDSSTLNKDELLHFLQKAKIGLQFEKEINLNKRTTESHQIRVFKMTASDKKELKKYVKNAMPQYFPI